jgi:hypothetical protein
MSPDTWKTIPCVSEQGIISIEQRIKSSHQGIYQPHQGIPRFPRKKLGTGEFALEFAVLSCYTVKYKLQ